MSFKNLKKFVSLEMRMSHIYQPVMLQTLLKNKGECHQEVIAKAILAHDPSQTEYYTKITNNMVGKVLRSREIVEKSKQFYRLNDYESLTDENIKTLKEICGAKIKQFLDERGQQVWEHRKKSKGYISGSVRYEVLKRAKYRCELCGISASLKALEVDHIVPRNSGGSDDISNCQSLCYSCNAMKRDRDNADLRGINDLYDHRESGCLFCDIGSERVLEENELAYVTDDKFPVTEGHKLIIPKRHTKDYFELGQAEINAINHLMTKYKDLTCAADPFVTGFNVGMNCGEDAGQTIFHCHIHLIPRRKGDVENPRGGIRHLIPGKGSY